MRRYFKQVENFALNKIKVNPNDAWAYNDLFVSQVVMEKIPEAEETLDLLDLISGLGQSYAIDALIQTMEKIQNLSGLEPDVRDFATQSIGKLKHSANGAS